MKTLILTLCILLLPCTAWAGGDTCPARTHEPEIESAIWGMSDTVVITDTRPALVWITIPKWNDRGETATFCPREATIKIEHGACEKLGLKHAWKFTHDMYCKCPYVHGCCENCGEETQVLKSEYR